MNIQENRLVKDLTKVENKDNYVEVPVELHGAAKKALRGKDEVIIARNSGGKLSEWAAEERRKCRNRKKKAKQNARNRRK